MTPSDTTMNTHKVPTDTSWMRTESGNRPANSATAIPHAAVPHDGVPYRSLTRAKTAGNSPSRPIAKTTLGWASMMTSTTELNPTTAATSTTGTSHFRAGPAAPSATDSGLGASRRGYDTRTGRESAT